ncbi:MAG: hypothetical protein A3J65_00740 [Candidatus Buchananbacteria bacterium RIFCSPHIGHO2_02_FULL_45_11b]|uniref:PrgI family protein n=4 Tax=Candidatus Buchananiibacteriota TaxID=1817903 RepID=A0A1G1YFF4_9BACT|nr:MAG: hypothetical protein A2663_00325 [Candidatus Buchananbacteria bacterium RIFCSPHIGHO2_01_FULL_46_12]OGY51072.1 MAG: hypothetical protein A3J65_00740 [Candidatus Buchananbacteria bacterium RIFCSPHIGHO2_02_FULL_45_11b]OGY53753.1 MAG: hypothetical protein A3B15_02510 [Candidatus Buchananbacteria bacterium RIFCSPLOWO2_01_FULL_45_31]OGY57215.1 MAG: hypothetical protein A3H67_02125 [Candidatus Buchananbacteria bacterium RIFCSPLOWO2_02_FULL_46_11b]
MEQFTVPQFIDVEDKVIGPITVRQFIILLFGGGFIFIAYRLSDFVLFLIGGIIILTLTLGLAFIKVNGRPVHYFLLNLIQTSLRARLRIWQKIYSQAELKEFLKTPLVQPAPPAAVKNKIRASRLAEMALIVDTGGIYEGEKEPGSKDLI